ncbi:hypothetical protein [Leptolyngbya boryana]|jgi:Sec-independent protein translocase protein TatA|nr:hypothetical protein [Leptolyngbya boryana]ULP33163.1 hypothetical protein MCP04_28840 [Leptolyngbya boryana IU 594]
MPNISINNGKVSSGFIPNMNWGYNPRQTNYNPNPSSVSTSNRGGMFGGKPTENRVQQILDNGQRRGRTAGEAIRDKFSGYGDLVRQRAQERYNRTPQGRIEGGFTSPQPFPRASEVVLNRSGDGSRTIRTSTVIRGSVAVAAVGFLGDAVINAFKEGRFDWQSFRRSVIPDPVTEYRQWEELIRRRQGRPPNTNIDWRLERGRRDSTSTVNFQPTEVPYTFRIGIIATRYNRDAGSVRNPGTKELTPRSGEDSLPVSSYDERIGTPLAIQRFTTDESNPDSTDPNTVADSGRRIVNTFFLVWKRASGEQVREMIGQPVNTAVLEFGNFRVILNAGSPAIVPDPGTGIDPFPPPRPEPPPIGVIFPPPPVFPPPVIAPPPDRRIEPVPPPDRRIEPVPPPDRRGIDPPVRIIEIPPPNRRLEPPPGRPPIKPGIDPKPRVEVRQEIRVDQRPNFAPEVNLNQRPNFAPEVNLNQRPNFAPEIGLRQQLDGRITTDFLKDGRLKSDKIQEIQGKAEKRVEPDQTTPGRCQNDCIADLQLGQQAQNQQRQMTAVMVDRFVTWNSLTGAVFIKEPVQVPSDLAPFAKMMGDRTANIRSRFGLAELRARLTQVMNTLSTAASLHNAAMLSANLGQTLGDVVTQSVQTFAPMFGVDKTAAEAFDFNEVLGKAVNETMENALGAETWNGTKATFTKLNRIVTTASQIVWTVRSIADSSREIAEWTAENTGKIGNALKRFRVVGENAYPWMPERVTAQSKWQQRMQKFRDGQENLDDAASSIASVVGEVRSITEEVNEFREQKEAFDKAIKEATPNSRPDNDSTKATADQSNAASKSPTLQPTDRTKGDAE